MSNRTGYGRDKAVKRENQSESGLDLTACNTCNTKQDCEDVVVTEVPATTEVRGIMADGKEHLFDKVYKINDPLLKGAIDYVAGHYEVSPKYVCAEYADGKHTINHIGEHTLGNLTGTDGTQLSGTVTRLCNYKSICNYKLDLPGTAATAASSLVVKNESGVEVVNEALAADYSTVNETNATALQADIQGKLPTGLTAKVTADTVATAYNIELEMPEGYTASLGGEDFVCCECEHKFVA